MSSPKEAPFVDNLKNLRESAKFSMEELIPILEEQISSMQGEEYKIDFFITNEGNCSLLDVCYLAFPKKEAYTKALFSYNGFIYRYVKKSDTIGSLQKLEASQFSEEELTTLKSLEITENDEVFLIAKEKLPINKSFNYLVMPQEERYLLFKDFFCYGKQLDEISSTIEEFAQKKVEIAEKEKQFLKKIPKI